MLTPEDHPEKKHRHLKRNLALVTILVLVLAVATIVVAGFVFGLSGCFGGYGCFISTTSSCSIITKLCQIAISDSDNTGLVASSCTFDIGGQNVVGVLSSGSGDPPTTVALRSSSSVMVYCSGYPRTPGTGAQVTGAVQFSNAWQTQFSSTWH